MTEVGKVYGEALYGLAREEALSNDIFNQLSVLEESFCREPNFLRLLSAPNLPKQERCRIIHESFSEYVHPYVLNFLKILTNEGHVRHFPHCCATYREYCYLDHDILPVVAVTATPLTDIQEDRLQKKLSDVTGKHITITNWVDPGILGGVRLDFDGKRLEDTISHRLEAIRTMLSNTIL